MNASLNHVYRIIWNATLGLWQVASEVTRGRGKSRSSQQARRLRRQAALAALGVMSGAAQAALPTGGVVVAGSATISQNGSALNINQSTDRAALDWQSFSVGQGNSVNFVQPSASSVALNRVLGNDVSVIQGAINANGQVFLVNQNGVLFTPTAQVNVGGLVASTQNISTADFMAGKYQFSGNSTATVENQGSITTTPGGLVALIAAKVINSGSITSPQGTVGLAAGNTVVVDLGGPVKIQVTEGALDAAIEQSGGIRADGGTIYLTAKAAGDLAASVINHSGVTKALSMAALTGSVQLTADAINQSGVLDVTGTVNGGDITLNAVTLTDSGTTLADGLEAGGRIVQHASANLTQTATAKVSASGGNTGGHVELFAGFGDGNTGIGSYGGQILATGRRKGGFIETSGSTVKLDENTLVINAGSSEGKAGTWLIDPNDYTIAATGGDVTGAFLSSQLQTQTVEIRSAQGATEGNGDIHVNDSITGPAGKPDNFLLMYADRDININKSVSVTTLGLYAKGSVNVNDVVSVTELDLIYGADAGFNPSATVKPSDTAALNMGMNANGFTGRIDVGTGPLSGVTINGTTYSVVRTIADMQAIGSNLAKSYVLATDLDFTGASAFKAIGSGTAFSGRFDGLGHQVKNLTSVETSGVSGHFGLFGNVSGAITNLGVGGTLNYQYPSSGGPKIGGLATNLQAAGILRNVYSTVNIYAYSNFNASYAGGLVAASSGSITNAVATGTVKAIGFGTNAIAGGLVGLGGGVISRSYATGAVSVGSTGIGSAGGLVGQTGSTTSIQNAYATGSVTSINANTTFDGSGTTQSNLIYLGGLVGSHGAVSALTINGAFATGLVSQTGLAPTTLKMGGLLGNNQVSTTSTLQNAYWDPTSTAQTSALATNSTKPLATDTSISAAIGTSGTTFANLDASIWGVSGGTPYLRAIPAAVTTAPIYINLNCGILCNNTYGDAITLNFGAFNAASGGTLLTDAALTGTATYNVYQGATLIGNTLDSLTDAGTYTITYTGGLTSTNSTYVINPGAAVTWTVDPRTLTVTLQGSTANPLTKAYDGTTSLALSAQNFLLGNFVGTQGTGAALNGITTGSFNNANVLQANTVSASLTGATLVLGSGINASNYKLPTTNNSTVSAAGTITPKALTINGSMVTSKTYDGQRDATVTLGTLSPLVSGETLGLTLASGQFSTKDAGIDKDVAVTYTLVDGASTQSGIASNYSLASETLKGTITPKSLGVSGLTAADKIYDAKLTATVSGTATVDTSAVIDKDDVTVSGTVTGGLFADKHVGTDKAVSITGLTLSGKDASNYQLSPAALTADITTLAVTVSGLSASNKTYDGTREATVSSANAVFDSLIKDDVLGVTGTGLFTDKDVGTGKTVNFNELMLSGADAKNYALTNTTATASADITPRMLTITGTTVANKIYDGTTAATVTAGTLGNLVAGETLGATMATGTFGTKDSANDGTQNVTVAYTLANGANPAHKASNYTLAGETLQAKILRKQLTITGTTVADKQYDGTNAMTATAILANLSGLVTVNGVTEAFADIKTNAFITTGGRTPNLDVGDKTVDVLYTLTEMDGGVSARSFNYLAPVKQTFTAKVTPRVLTITGTTVANKTYDGLTNAVVTVGTLGNLVAGEMLGTTTASGTFADKDAATDKNVTVAYTLANGINAKHKASNYTLAGETLKGTITPKSVSVSGIAAQGKTYDGTKTATITNQGVVATGIDGESLSVSTTGEFNDKNAGARQVNTSTTLADSTSALASNYSLSNATNAVDATIAVKVLEVSGIAANNKAYDGSTTAVISKAGVVTTGIDGESLVVKTTGNFNGKNAGTSSVSTSSNLADGVGGLASNYSLSNSEGTVEASIMQRVLAIAGSTVSDRDYDGTKSATVNVGELSNVVEGETLGMTTAVGTFADQNAGKAKDVEVIYTLANGAGTWMAGAPVFDSSGNVIGSKPIEVPGALASNYTLAGETLKGTITPKSVSVSGIAAQGKTYDGTNTATITNQGVVATGIEGESLSISTTGEFNDKNAGARQVNTSTTLADSTSALASNYSLSNATNAVDATIAAKVLGILGFTAADKTYNASAAATISNAGTLDGVVMADLGKVTLGNTGATFDTKDVGTAKTVTLNGTSLSGIESGNYVLSKAAVTDTADITAKTLTISGFTAADKTYNANTTANITNAGSLVGVETLDLSKVALNNTGATFDTKDVGIGKTVTLNGTSLSGDEAKNYVLSKAAVTDMADISAKELSISGFTAADKIYSASTTATITNAGSLVGVEMADATKVTLGNTGATFDTKNVGTNKTVTLNGANLSGTESGNYVLSKNAVTDMADITAKALTVGGITAESKTYDAQTGAVVSVAKASLDGLIEGDKLTVSATGDFTDKNAAMGKTVNLTSTYAGDDVTNYSITDQATTTADITAKALSVSGITAESKTYDAQTGAVVSVAKATLNGLIEGDKLMVSATGEFSDKNAATGKTVNLTSTYAGADVKNYAITDQATTTADITAKSLSVSGITAANKVYDTNTGAEVSVANAALNGLIEGDKLTVSATGTFSDKNAAMGKTVNLTSTYAGADVKNYVITDQATTIADIAKLAGVTVTANAQSKLVNQQDPTLTFSVTGLLADDTLSGGLSREAGEAAGLYAINQGTLNNDNYVISEFTPALLTISQPIAEVAIANANRIEAPALKPSLGDRDPVSDEPDNIQPLFVSPARAGSLGPAQIVVVNGGIRLPAGVVADPLYTEQE